MKIAIISDIHDNLVNLEKCLNWCGRNNIKEIICCGDVTNSDTLEFLSENFSGRIHLVRGNIELFPESEPETYSNINYHGRIARIKFNETQVGICHEPYLIDYVFKKGGCDIIFYGHTHEPWEDRKNGARLINPGTLGAMFSKATFAVWDTKSGNIELKILEII
ncbi:YfcE family phosphodiesterase [Patescibacteria group bacterium]|nr:YfcE family phosphodiesterase [Candidatus Falkowbacteria bacterium]MBU3905586.1 YfcE family phosphodiesterase [Patescibacteria group bacterium]MCG2698766.1 YfcE family phosphodiesterase [Candidatus Parcubacteria bacterium]MBU4014798.1 YfcE family phosphodiesterase [Patescibacteria group bacterium]MBU4026271.1 YfcE family phosphodiesterase [Patescibacteria group bacterium]